jgi:hypothetical protein
MEATCRHIDRQTQVSQDPLNHAALVDRCHQAQPIAAVRTGQDVDLEGPAQKIGLREMPGSNVGNTPRRRTRSCRHARGQTLQSSVSALVGEEAEMICFSVGARRVLRVVC